MAVLACVLSFQLSLQADDHLTLVWSDEFEYTGLPDTNKWSYDVGGHGWGNNELQYYTEGRIENVKVENGVLTIEARKESFQGSGYTSTRLVSRNKGDWKYGRFEIRAKLPRGRGTWPAIWMLPTDWVYGGWPGSGEIDIMEHVGYDMNRVHGTIHTEAFNHTKGTQIGTSIVASNVDTEFHVYSLEWWPDRIDVFLDGERYFSVSDNGSGFAAWPFDQRFHLIMNIAVGGNWGGAQGIDDSIYPQRMEVDYVRVYELVEPVEEPGIVVPARIEAEDLSAQFGMQLEQTSDIGGGFNAGFLGDGDWAEYKLDVQFPGQYAFDLRYASLNGTAAVNLSLGSGSPIHSGTLAATGGWQSWTTQRVALMDLSAGEHILRVTIEAPSGEDLNYNWIDAVLLESAILDDPYGDPDIDGIPNIFEHAFLLDEQATDSQEMLPHVHSDKRGNSVFARITYRQRSGGTGATGTHYHAGGVTYQVETSSTLQSDSWLSGTNLFRLIGDPIDNGDGSESVTVEFAFPVSNSGQFLRLNLITDS